jgi:hypothetical protein
MTEVRPLTAAQAAGYIWPACSSERLLGLWLCWLVAYLSLRRPGGWL